MPHRDEQAPIDFPQVLENVNGALKDWLEEKQVHDGVQYRKVNEVSTEHTRLQLYVCHRAAYRQYISDPFIINSQEEVKKQSANSNQIIDNQIEKKTKQSKVTFCQHSIQVRSSVDSDQILISSPNPIHTGHTPGSIDDLQLLSVSEQTKQYILRLHRDGLSNKQIKKVIEGELLGQLEQKDRNYNLRFVYVQNHRAINPGVRDIANIVRRGGE